MDAQIDLSTSSFCTNVITTQKKYEIDATANYIPVSHIPSHSHLFSPRKSLSVIHGGPPFPCDKSGG